LACGVPVIGAQVDVVDFMDGGELLGNIIWPGCDAVAVMIV